LLGGWGFIVGLPLAGLIRVLWGFLIARLTDVESPFGSAAPAMRPEPSHKPQPDE
jgi:hypothetical protein